MEEFKSFLAGIALICVGIFGIIVSIGLAFKFCNLIGV